MIDLDGHGAQLRALLAPGWTLVGPTVREGRWVVGARPLQPSGRADGELDIEIADPSLERAFSLLEDRLLDVSLRRGLSA